MPAASFGFHFFDPPPSNNLNEPGLSNQIQPFLVLFASSADCLPIAQKLSEAGWLVLAVDIQQPIYLELALDLISPPSRQLHWEWLKPAAIILLTDDHLPILSNSSLLPALSLPIQLHHLTRQLQNRNLFPQDIPYLLYGKVSMPSFSPATVEEQVPPSTDYIQPDITTSMIFRAVIQGTGQGEELLAVIADLTQIIFCAGCRCQIEPHVKALLLAPHLFCEKCASFPNAVIDRYPQERLPLFPARFLAKAARIFATSPAKQAPYPVLSSQEVAPNVSSDPWSNELAEGGTILTDENKVKAKERSGE